MRGARAAAGVVKDFVMKLGMEPRKSNVDVTVNRVAVAETGEKNAALLKAIAFAADSKLKSDLNAVSALLVETAKKKLLTATNLAGPLFELGPLMRAVMDAGATMKAGWSDRHQPAWSEELDRHNVPLTAWIEHMLDLLKAVQEEADIAIDAEQHGDATMGLRMRDFLSSRA